MFEVLSHFVMCCHESYYKNIYIYILTSNSIESPCITPVSYLVSQDDIKVYGICILYIYKVPRLFCQGAVKLVNEVTRNQV